MNPHKGTDSISADIYRVAVHLIILILLRVYTLREILQQSSVTSTIFTLEHHSGPFSPVIPQNNHS